MNGIARAQQRFSQAATNDNKLGGLTETSKTRVYAQADTVFLQERLTRALSGDRAFEVAIDVDGEQKRNACPNTKEKDILVMFSTGLVLEDLHRVQGWKTALPGLRVLLLGASQREGDFLQYVRSGIRGFLPGDAGAKEIVNAVHALSKGDAICGGGQCSVLFSHLEREAESFPSAALHRDLGLTRREQQLIPLLTRGLTNKEIANHFSLSEQTVKNHLYRMKRKVGASGRLEIVDLCRQHGFLA
jgi:DNA-binding NarL/FixJ family response regulator